LVDRSILYGCYTNGDVGNQISDRLGNPSRDIPIGNESRVYGFGFFGSGHFPMGSSPFFLDWISYTLYTVQFSCLSPFFEMDQVLSLTQEIMIRIAQSAEYRKL
jgi:hypothetical protein